MLYTLYRVDRMNLMKIMLQTEIPINKDLWLFVECILNTGFLLNLIGYVSM